MMDEMWELEAPAPRKRKARKGRPSSGKNWSKEKGSAQRLSR